MSQDQTSHGTSVHGDSDAPSHPHLRHYRRKHFISHEGRHIHVASSPTEIENLRKELASSDEPFDLCVTGSPEHLDHLRKTHSHYEERREALRQLYGELYENFQTVHSELAWLGAELEDLTSHEVLLESNFSKYGYSARLRTYDDGSPSPTSTPAASIHSGHSDKYKSPLKIFKAPIVRQYIHKGVLWRAANLYEPAAFELFVDLLYVGIIAINGDYASEDPTGLSLLHFVITICMSYRIWNELTLQISWFDTNDIGRRFQILFTLACLLGFTTDITQAFEKTYSQLVAFYLAARLFNASYLLYVGIMVPMIRMVMLMSVLTTMISAGLWIASIYINWPGQLAPILIALVVDLIAPFPHIIVVPLRASHRIVKRWVDDKMQFWPALNIEHNIERTNGFVSLVFGYTVVALLYQNSSSMGLNAFFGKAVLGLIQAFCFNWLYFEVDGSNISMHAIRRHRFSSFLWNWLHIPFITSFILAGGALSRLVLAHDCPDTSVDSLTDAYEARSAGEIEYGIRWFYCAGLAVALMTMALISITHVHKEIPTIRLKKRYRLVTRSAIAVTILCLSTATHLNSMELIGVVTALVALALMLELWCANCCRESLWDTSKGCDYVGRCGKGEIKNVLNTVQETNGTSYPDTMAEKV